MRNYVQRGETLSLTAPDDTDHDEGGNSGAGILIGSIFGVACNDFASGGSVEVMVEGVFDLPKAVGAWAQGQPIYWDNTAKVVTTSNAGPNKLVGVSVLDASSCASTGRLRLNESFG